MSDLTRSWLDLPAAAALTGRSRRTVERWVADDRLDTLVVLGRTRVNEQQLLEVERDTRHAARRGRPGARPPVERLADALDMPAGIRQALVLPRSGVVSSLQSRGIAPDEDGA